MASLTHMTLDDLKPDIDIPEALPEAAAGVGGLQLGVGSVSDDLRALIARLLR